jgi:hypothetical protein
MTCYFACKGAPNVQGKQCGDYEPESMLEPNNEGFLMSNIVAQCEANIDICVELPNSAIKCLCVKLPNMC